MILTRIDLGTLFDTLAERGAGTTVHLDRPFDIAPEGGTEYGVEQLMDLTNSAAGWLAAAGVGPGDRVAIVKDNHWDTVLLVCAAARLGAVPAPIYHHLASDTVQTMLERLEPAVLATTGSVLDTAWDAGVDLMAFADRTLILEQTPRLDRPVPGALDLEQVHGHQPPPPHRRGHDEPLVVCHTSGTTGVPKLVMHSTRTLIHRLVGFEAHRWPVLASRRDDTVATATSFVHGRATCWTAAVFWLQPQQVVVITDAARDRAEPVLREHPPTTLEALPSTYIRWQPMTASTDNPFRDVRLFISTFDAIHPPAVRAFLAASQRRHPLLLQGWGQSETGPLTFRFLSRKAMATVGDRHPTTRNLGWPTPTRTRLRVVDPETFRPVPRGRQGLMLARTKARCLDYLGEHERWTAKVDGPWFNTGDIGIHGRNGSLRLLDREVDGIPGTSCVELEDVLDDRLPALLECIILGVPDRPPLPVVVTEDGQLDSAAWEAAISDLPQLAEPMVLTWDELPRTGTGKVRRLELRERLLGDAQPHGAGRWT